METVANEVVELVDLLIENEIQLARYYQAMGDFIPEHRETWMTLECEEQAHAEALRRIRRVVEKDPMLFAIGKCSPNAVRTVTSDIAKMLEMIDRGEVHPRYALTYIIDVEFSSIEGHLDDSLRTDVVEVQNILAWLKKQTEAHHDRLLSVTL